MSQTALALALTQATEGRLSVLDLTKAAQALRDAEGLTAVRSLYQAWIDRHHDDPLLYAVLFNFSVVLTDLGDLTAARAGLERAIALKPDFMPPYINLGRLLERQGAPDQAVQQWMAVVQQLGAVNETAILHKTTALNQMARLLEARHQDEAAESMLRQSAEIDVTQREALQHLAALRQRQCKWPVLSPSVRLGRDRQMAALSPLSAAALADDPMMQLAVAWSSNKFDVGRPQDDVIGAHWAACAQTDAAPLRIGYLSSDLRGHAVGTLVAELFALHDRGAVEIFAYYCGPPGEDALQTRMRAAVDHWLDITALDDRAAARRIADDGIQILVDLNGYTKDARTKLVALQPAPVIVNWLGYPGSMASPYHHYIIADAWVIPPDHEIFYSERVLRLPCYQPNDRQRTAAGPAPTRGEVGLPDDAMVYCCFNGAHKITAFTFARWMTILARVPGSALWLLGGSAAAEARLKQLAGQQGIAPERLIFADKQTNAQHLARYELADLFLDTLPYGAHTTASDALWMGLPVLTQSGRSFAARVCGSLVRAAGIAELDCRTAEEYVDRAVAIGRDRAGAKIYRQRLLAARPCCPLFDTPRLVGALEQLYAQIWQEFRAGRRPIPDLVNLDIILELAGEQDYDGLDMMAIKDYRGWWRDKLVRYHAFRPIPRDRRLWRKTPKKI
jgi:predicted O-linked N-acetylglucosamine transferase (SPINDLY family)